MIKKKPDARIVRRGPQGGFTLIEILIAMTIFSTSFLALAAGATTVMKSNHSSYNDTIATTLAQDKLEELMAGTALPTCANFSDCTDIPATDRLRPRIAGNGNSGTFQL